VTVAYAYGLVKNPGSQPLPTVECQPGGGVGGDEVLNMFNVRGSKLRIAVPGSRFYVRCFKPRTLNIETLKLLSEPRTALVKPET